MTETVQALEGTAAVAGLPVARGAPCMGEYGTELDSTDMDREDAEAAGSLELSDDYTD
jgi:hypothetical protein